MIIYRSNTVFDSIMALIDGVCVGGGTEYYFKLKLFSQSIIATSHYM